MDNNEKIFHKAYHQLSAVFDARYGGFGPVVPQTVSETSRHGNLLGVRRHSGPKFPMPQHLLFLQRYALRFKRPHARHMVLSTLEKMARGGIFDHVGGGFFRYAHDEKWLLPHMEKTLPDNAWMATCLAEAGLHTTARRVLDWCLAEMRAENNGFYNKQTADTSILYTPDSVTAILDTDAEQFCALFNITSEGHINGKSLPNLVREPLAADNQAFAASALLRLRAHRKTPSVTDMRQLTGYNGLMLGALATAGRMLSEPQYTISAAACANFILSQCVRDGRLLASAVGDNSAADMNDYVFTAWGLYRLHQATLEQKWLTAAESLMAVVIQQFLPTANKNAMTYTSIESINADRVIGGSAADVMMPGGMAIAAGMFQRLYRLTRKPQYQDAYNAIITAMIGLANKQPLAHTALLAAMVLNSAGTAEVAIDPNKDSTREHAKFHPFVTLDKLAATEQPYTAASHLSAAGQLFVAAEQLPRTVAVVAQNGASMLVESSTELRELLRNK